ncbi:MAG: ribosomal protein S18-alanine N-acetyltransferase [Anaerolineaceae bacterium]|nr:ribosomal protein S18-alanine N-acetyltransferase [Anaerolineaceae bacterium]
MQVTIRPMELRDVAQVYTIEQLSFSLPWPERSFYYELVENPSTRLWVAEVSVPGGQPALAGMLVMWVVVDEAHIGTFATHPDYRRQRIGLRLLAHALTEATREGVERVFLEVRRSNEPAQTLYGQFGFEVTGVRPRYYRDTGEDALLMTLDPLHPEKLPQVEEGLD